MREFFTKRALIYLGVVATLASVWVVGEVIIAPDRTPEIYQVPEDSLQSPAGLVTSGGDRSRTKDQSVGEADKASDEFERSLRELADKSANNKVEEASVVSATPTLPPTANPQSAADNNSSQQRDSASGDRDDARSIFSGLESEPGSRVDDILPGIVSRGAALGDLVTTPAATPTTSRGWVTGQARGYTMLYAMQANARTVVETNIQALLSSRVREPYIGVLIDGTFGRDFGYLKEVITRLSDDDRDLTVALYLSNGPTMRKWKETPIDEHIFARIDPIEFRSQIRRNASLRAEFLAVTIQARDIFKHNASLNPGNNNIAIVMLEDNLDVASYRTLREIAAEQVGSLAGFVRNPCLGCGVEGSDDATLGDPREEHKLDRFSILKQGDAYSLDGVGFRYPNAAGVGVSPEQLDSLLKASVERGLRSFGLWRHNWQGVVEGVDNKHPEERNFVASTPDQQAFEIQALRTGLINEVDEKDSERQVAVD